MRLRTLSGTVPPTVVLFSVTMAGGAVLTFAPQLTDSATAALYSFPVALATMAVCCLLTAVVAVIVPSPRRTTRR